jgi:hypothetical protein
MPEAPAKKRAQPRNKGFHSAATAAERGRKIRKSHKCENYYTILCFTQQNIVINFCFKN